MTQSTDRAPSRRTVLASGGTLAATALTGCLGRGSASVSVLSAGSLAQTFESHIGPAFEDETDISVHGEYYGANAVMRMVESQTKHPDVIVSADATLLRDRLYTEVTDWDIEFASNTVGLGYNEETAIGDGLEAGEPWYELIRASDEGDVSIGDPNLDPLGYRAVQAFKLAEAEYGIDGLADELLKLVYQEPEEPQMMAGVESGARAAAVVYRNMAIDHEMPFVSFTDAYNFSDPSRAEQYATVSYTTDEEGYTAKGRPIMYNATVHDDADEPDHGRSLVQFLIDNPDVLLTAGLSMSESLPRAKGAVPDDIRV